jgi:hypothetical protein
MKIGILTFQWAKNYGALLQMYALKEYVGSLGHEIKIIDFTPNKFASMYSLNFLRKGITFKHRIKKIIDYILKKKQHKEFEIFFENNFSKTKLIDNSKELNKNINEFDLIIVGSDQVWNEKITEEYFLDYFLPDYEGNKISYAASFGSNNISKQSLYLIKKHINEFDFVSLREGKTVKLLKKITKKDNIKLVLDPVFLISPDKWYNFSSDKISGDYILIYMLENNRTLLDTAVKMSNYYNLPIYSVEIPFTRRLNTTKKINKLNDLGPKDFVQAFKDANYILTNSFHGTSYSLLFEKKFLSFNHSTVNLRMKNLFELYELGDLQINDKVPSIDRIKNIFNNYDECYNSDRSKIDKHIDFSKKYIQDSISALYGDSINE